MSEVIADPSSSKIRAFLASIRNRALQVFQQVKRYKRRSGSHYRADKLIATVVSLMTHVTLGWNPRRDPTVRKCVKELKQFVVHTGSIGDAKSKEICKMRLAAIAKWKVEDPSATVKRPTSSFQQ